MELKPTQVNSEIAQNWKNFSNLPLRTHTQQIHQSNDEKATFGTTVH